MKTFNEILEDPGEASVQTYLEANPHILLSAFSDRWAVNECLPKFKFGNEFVSDFVIVSGQSYSYNIILIELEPPTEKIFTKSGVYSKRLNGAVGQVNDWLGWIHDNMDYFRESIIKDLDNHYGSRQLESLHGNRFQISAKIIIGRRSMLSKEDNKRRSTIYAQNNKTLEIVPFDRLVEIEQKLKEAAEKRK